MQILNVTGGVVTELMWFRSGFPRAVVVYKRMDDLSKIERALAEKYVPVVEEKVGSTEILRVLLPEAPEHWCNGIMTVFDERDADAFDSDSAKLFIPGFVYEKGEPEKTVWVTRGFRFDSLDKARTSVRRGNSIDHLVSVNWT